MGNRVKLNNEMTDKDKKRQGCFFSVLMLIYYSVCVVVFSLGLMVVRDVKVRYGIYIMVFSILLFFMPTTIKEFISRKKSSEEMEQEKKKKSVISLKKTKR